MAQYELQAGSTDRVNEYRATGYMTQTDIDKTEKPIETQTPTHTHTQRERERISQTGIPSASLPLIPVGLANDLPKPLRHHIAFPEC